MLGPHRGLGNLFPSPKYCLLICYFILRTLLFIWVVALLWRPLEFSSVLLPWVQMSSTPLLKTSSVNETRNHWYLKFQRVLAWGDLRHDIWSPKTLVKIDWFTLLLRVKRNLWNTNSRVGHKGTRTGLSSLKRCSVLYNLPVCGSKHYPEGRVASGRF